MNKTAVRVGALAIVAMVAMPQVANATFAMIFGTFVCNDNAACDINPAAGQITVMTGVLGVPTTPGFSAEIGMALTNAPGGLSSSILNTTWNVTSTIPGSKLTVLVSATGFAFPANGMAASLTSQFSGSVVGVGNVTVQQWANLANILFGLGPITTGLQGPFTTTSFSNSASVGFTSVTPYSITQQIVFDPGDTVLTGELAATIVTVPEPATLLLIGFGLIGLAFSRRSHSST